MQHQVYHVLSNLEYELKLLYTAVTRSRAKLVFAEPNEKAKGVNAFKRWLIGDKRNKSRFGSACSSSDLDKSVAMTSEEWVVRGLRMTKMGQDKLDDDPELDQATTFRDGIECFKNAEALGEKYLERLQGQIRTAKVKKSIDRMKAQSKPFGGKPQKGDIVIITENSSNRMLKILKGLKGWVLKPRETGDIEVVLMDDHPLDEQPLTIKT